jgi:hypothetical protein
VQISGDEMPLLEARTFSKMERQAEFVKEFRGQAEMVETGVRQSKASQR